MLNRIEEDKDEITDDVVVSMLQEKLEFEISIKDIDRSHRIGKPSSRKKRPIIVKFVRYNNRHKVYSNKKRSKDSGISITESLTAYRMGQLNKACDKHGFRNVWNHDGIMMVRFSSKKMVATVQDYFMVKWGKRHIVL